MGTNLTTAGPGRPKGLANKTTRELREWIMKNANPVEFLASVMNGTFPISNTPATPEHRITASIQLLKKVLPDADKTIDANGDPTSQVQINFSWNEED